EAAGGGEGGRWGGEGGGGGVGGEVHLSAEHHPLEDRARHGRAAVASVDVVEVQPNGAGLGLRARGGLRGWIRSARRVGSPSCGRRPGIHASEIQGSQLRGKR